MSDQATGGFEWDDEVDSERKERPVLPEGEAAYVIRSLKRERKAYGKFGTINVAVLTLDVQSTIDNQCGEMQCQIGLHHDLDWKITQLFTSIGQRKKGDKGKFAPDWSKVEGSSGLCMIGIRTFKKKTDADGQASGTANEVTEFLPEPASTDKPPANDDLQF